MRDSFHLLAFHIHLSLILILAKETSEEKLIDDYFEPSYQLEPTPVFVHERSSTYYKIGWPQDMLKYSDDSRYEGSGREKRGYNLEDFLVWMPSGDGPLDKWNQKPVNQEWIRPFTKTVYITKTKYETMVFPTNVNAYPTVKDIFPTKTTTNNFGKDIYGNFGKGFDTGCKIPPVYGSQHYYGSTFPLQADQGITTMTDDFIAENNDFGNIYPQNKFLPTPAYRGNGPEERLPTKLQYPDIQDFLHSSLGYEGPSSIVTHPHMTSHATPTLPSKVKEFDLSGTANIVSIFSTKDFRMQTTHIELPSKFMPKASSQFIVSSTFYPPINEHQKTPKAYDTTLFSEKQTQESTTPIFDIFHTSKTEITSESYVSLTQTVNYNFSTDETAFTVPVSSIINVTRYLLLNSTTIEPNIKYQNGQSTDIVFETTTVPTFLDNIDNKSLILTNKTSCNCSTFVETSTAKQNITANKESKYEKIGSPTLPSTPDETLSIPSVFPSPSNNATTPINKTHWIRTTFKGPPTTSNKLEFRNEITKKLTKVYKYAYKISSTKNSSDYNSAALLDQNQRLESFIVVTTDGSVSRNRIQRDIPSLYHQNNFLEMKKFELQRNNKIVLNRKRRQISNDISVRIQNITYMAEPNTTELVYSVFKGDRPVEAVEAVEKISSVNETVIENFLGYVVAVKAEEYLQTEKYPDEETKKFYATIFSSLIAVIVLLVITVCLIWKCHKKYKRRHTQSTDNLGDGSEEYPPGSHHNIEGGRENLGFAEMHDEESTPEVSGSRRSSQYAMDSQSHSSRPSLSQEPVPYPKTKYAEERGYAVVDRRVKPFDERSTSAEHEYSTPKPISQIQTNIQIGLDYAQDKKSEYIPGTSLPRFLPPPRQVLIPSPSPESRPQLPSRSYLLDESYGSKPGTSQDRPIITEVQERTSLDRSMSGMSKGSSELETSPNSPSLSSGAGIGRLRRRFHDLLDDAFSLMQGQKPGDKVTPLATPFHIQNSRARSAMPLRRPRLLDDLEGVSRTLTPERPHISLRPWSAAAVMHSPRDMISILPSGESTEGSPRSAWGDHGRSITPVYLPNQRSYDRPDSAPIPRMSNEGVRSPTPIDPETGLRMYDPAVPLIRAIKEELNRFKASVNTDSSNA